MSETVADERENDSPKSLHAAAYAAVALFGFVILRIFAVSEYKWETAFLVSTTLSLDDGVSLLYGSLMAGELLTAILLAAVMPLLLAGSLWAPIGQRPVLILMSALGMVLVLALTVSSRIWWLLPTVAMIFGLLTLTRRLADASRVRTVTTRIMARIGWFAPVALLIIAAFVPTPWVPQEQIETRTGVITGYVLSADPGYLNILTEDHEFEIIVSTDVISRE